jgi:dipeptidyl-peptidase-4
VKRLAPVALLLAACAGPLAAPAPPPIDREAIARLAATRGYQLGFPRPVALLPDGDVLFLRTGARSYVAELFELDAATGATRRVASADALVASADVALSAAEKARRERTRTVVRGIVSVEVSRDGSRLLVPIGERVFAIDRASGVTSALELGPGYPETPTLSPDGRRVAFVRDDEVWTADLAGGKPRRLTRKDGPDVAWGSAEFAAQEELDRTAGMWWSPDGSQLIVQRTDNARVDTLYVSDPRHPDVAPTPFRYPRAGTHNADVRLGIIGASGGELRWIEWDRAAFPYVHHVQWPENAPPTLVVLNRAQTELRVLAVDVETGRTATLVTETDPAWVNTSGGPRWAADGRSFLWPHEVALGWELGRHDATGRRTATLVAGDVGFHGEYDVDEETGEVWFVRDTGLDRHVYSVDAQGGNLRQHTDAPGIQRVEVARRGGSRLFFHSGADGSRSISLIARDGRPIAPLPSVAEDDPRLPNVSVGTTRGAERTYATAITRPRSFDASLRYPVVLQVYAGPGVRTVSPDPRAYWEDQLLADTGFIVVRGDGRGTPGRGRAWERVISGDLISVPLADQIDLLQGLGRAHPELDLDRVGVVGWSFGGYFAAMAALLRPDVFKAAIAGAPVSDWRFYDTAYTERYMRMPDENPEGYDATSAVVNAGKLGAPLLLIHGLTDDNVHLANTLALAEALFLAGRDFDLLTLSTTHMLADPAAEAALMNREIDFLRAHLGLPIAAGGRSASRSSGSGGVAPGFVSGRRAERRGSGRDPLAYFHRVGCANEGQDAHRDQGEARELTRRGKLADDREARREGEQRNRGHHDRRRPREVEARDRFVPEHRPCVEEHDSLEREHGELRQGGVPRKQVGAGEEGEESHGARQPEAAPHVARSRQDA